MRWILAGASVILAVLLWILLKPKPDPIRPPDRLPPTWTVDRRTAPEFTRPQELIRQSLDSRRLRLVAAGLRAKGTAPLLSLLHDSSLSFQARCVVALVLGTIDDPQAQHALLRELQAAGDSEWIRILLHALGAEKKNPDAEIFDLPDTPFVYELAGLRLRIQTRVADDAVRMAMASFLTHADPEVRRAAARGLVHSTDFRDVRDQFVALVKAEADDNLRAGYGHALANWLAEHGGEAPDRSAVVDVLLSASDDAAVRFRIEEGLRRAPLSEAEVGRLIEIAERGSLHQQLWSLSILRARSEPVIVPVLERLAVNAAEPKVREYAVSGVRSEGVLLTALSDPEWNVRVAAVKALAGKKNVRAELERIAVSDPDERVRQAAQESLRR